MAYVIEAMDSRETKGSPPEEVVFRYNILGCQDDEEAQGLVFTKLPDTYRDLQLDNPSMRITRSGVDWFEIEATFVLPVVPDFPGGGGESAESAAITEFDTTGGTQHVTQCISQVPYAGVIEAWATAIREARVVGLTRDGVEGVDQHIPKLELSRTIQYPLANVSSLYIKNLSRITATTNIAPYAIGDQPYEAGELLFLGATGKQVKGDDGEWKWEITYRFSASQNRQNIVVTDNADPTKRIVVVQKKGHEYLWIRYKKDLDANAFIEVPDVAFVAKLYEESDFNSFIAVTL